VFVSLSIIYASLSVSFLCLCLLVSVSFCVCVVCIRFCVYAHYVYVVVRVCLVYVSLSVSSVVSLSYVCVFGICFVSVPMSTSISFLCLTDFGDATIIGHMVDTMSTEEWSKLKKEVYFLLTS
jgi:hypothetical protein